MPCPRRTKWSALFCVGNQTLGLQNGSKQMAGAVCACMMTNRITGQTDLQADLQTARTLRPSIWPRLRAATVNETVRWPHLTMSRPGVECIESFEPKLDPSFL